MRGHIRQRGKAGTWYAVIDLRDSTGQRKRKWQALQAKGKREAQIELAGLIKEIDDGDYVERDRKSLGEFLDNWERDWASVNVSLKTSERYSQILRLYVRPQLADKRMQAIGAADLNRLYAELHQKISPRTVRHVHRLLFQIFAAALKWGNIKRNPAALVDAPKVPPTEAAVLKAAEIPQMFDALRGSDLFSIAVVALGTGMRRGELCALRWQDVDLDGARLKVERSLEQTRRWGLRFKEPKSARGRRSISLSPAVVAEIRNHWKAQQERRLSLGLGKSPDDGLVFCNCDGTPLTPDPLTGRFCDAMKKAGLGHIGLHTLRHTHASQLITSGVDVLTVSRRLGHSSASITLNVYGHLLTTEDRSAEIMQGVLAGSGIG